MSGGSSAGDGAHCWWLLLRSISLSSGLSAISLTFASPGMLLQKTRWWSDLMPLKAWRLKNWLKWSAQLYCSAKHPTLVQRKRCLTKPKHQSGANLVCPTSINEISILSLSPARTRHVKYCMTKQFLFWPEQLFTGVSTRTKTG